MTVGFADTEDHLVLMGGAGCVGVLLEGLDTGVVQSQADDQVLEVVVGVGGLRLEASEVLFNFCAHGWVSYKYIIIEAQPNNTNHDPE